MCYAANNTGSRTQAETLHKAKYNRDIGATHQLISDYDWVDNAQSSSEKSDNRIKW